MVKFSGSGDLSDPSDFLIFDPSTGTYVTAEYPLGGAGFTGGGTLTGEAPFAIGLAGGDYTIVGTLDAGIAVGYDGDPTPNYGYCRS